MQGVDQRLIDKMMGHQTEEMRKRYQHLGRNKLADAIRNLSFNGNGHEQPLAPWGETLIEKDRLTVASLLKQYGYATAAIGKWHLGWQWPTKDGRPPRSGTDRLSNVDFTQRIDTLSWSIRNIVSGE